MLSRLDLINWGETLFPGERSCSKPPLPAGRKEQSVSSCKRARQIDLRYRLTLQGAILQIPLPCVNLC